MPYLNLDDNYADQRDVWRLSSDAFRLDVSAMLYAARLSTDGLVDLDTIPRLVPKFRRRDVDDLVDSGRWQPLDLDAGTFYVPEVMVHNRTADRIAEDRAGARRRQADLRERRRLEAEAARALLDASPTPATITHHSRKGVTRD